MNLGGTSEGYIKITEGSQLKSYACCLGTFYRKKKSTEHFAILSFKWKRKKFNIHIWVLHTITHRNFHLLF